MGTGVSQWPHKMGLKWQMQEFIPPLCPPRGTTRDQQQQSALSRYVSAQAAASALGGGSKTEILLWIG